MAKKNNRSWGSLKPELKEYFKNLYGHRYGLEKVEIANSLNTWENEWREWKT